LTIISCKRLIFKLFSKKAKSGYLKNGIGMHWRRGLIETCILPFEL
jgi:hypothetical protein